MLEFWGILRCIERKWGGGGRNRFFFCHLKTWVYVCETEEEEA